MRTLAPLLVWVALCPVSQAQQPAAEPEPIDHRGAWNCVLYGDPRTGDERVVLNFGADGTTRMAIPSEDVQRPWFPLSRWQLEEDALTFSDSRTGRNFSASLNRPTLGGEWRTTDLFGGWWCSETDQGTASALYAHPTGEPTAMTQPLIPEIMASPTYPRQAIREAKEGRVVVCFEVDPLGAVRDPQFIEYSDEIFRSPSLDALMQSHYKAWSDDRHGPARPACRSFVYSLEQIY